MKKNNKGWFQHGHKVLSVRDPKTGKFVGVLVTDFEKARYLEVREAVDLFLANNGGAS